MTVQEIIKELRTLSIDDRLVVLEVLSRDLRQMLSPRQGVPAEAVRGLLSSDGEEPGDEELSNSYIDYLLDKYGIPQSISGEDLIAFAHQANFDSADLEEIKQAIEDSCERLD